MFVLVYVSFIEKISQDVAVVYLFVWDLRFFRERKCFDFEWRLTLYVFHYLFHLKPNCFNDKNVKKKFPIPLIGNVNFNQNVITLAIFVINDNWRASTFPDQIQLIVFSFTFSSSINSFAVHMRSNFIFIIFFLIIWQQFHYMSISS